MKYRIKVKIEFEECGDETECGLDDVGQVVLSKEESISIDDVEDRLVAAGYESMRKAISDHFESVSKKGLCSIRPK